MKHVDRTTRQRGEHCGETRQLLAAAKTARRDANDTGHWAYHLAQKPALFNGVIRTYQPKAEDGVTLPSESQRVQHTVPDLLADFRGQWAD
jgi:hypothetical protein